MATSKQTTTLDRDNTKPSVTAPGDGPADTTDPAERASTVGPNPSAATIASGVGTVNAALPAPSIPEPAKKPSEEHRIEEYEVVGPDGKAVTVQHNIDTGSTRVKPSTDTGSVQTQSGSR